jgi:hypothetical protein
MICRKCRHFTVSPGLIISIGFSYKQQGTALRNLSVVLIALALQVVQALPRLRLGVVFRMCK